MELSRYIVLNPVRAGLCAHPAEWRWSGYRATTATEPPPRFLELTWLLDQFGGSTDEARAWFAEWVGAGLDRGRSS